MSIARRNGVELIVPSKLRANSHNHFFERKRLCDIVVGSEVEHAHLVFFRNFCRHDDYRHRHGFSEHFAHRETIDFGHHDIKQRKVGLYLACFSQCVCAVECLIGFMPCLFEITLHHIGYFNGVLCYKYLSHINLR